jgi:uncharacterized protein (DUF2267 family)
MEPLRERKMKISVSIQHLSREAVVRYLTRSISPEERETVEWHLEHCPICGKEISVRDIL